MKEALLIILPVSLKEHSRSAVAGLRLKHDRKRVGANEQRRLPRHASTPPRFPTADAQNILRRYVPRQLPRH